MAGDMSAMVQTTGSGVDACVGEDSVEDPRGVLEMMGVGRKTASHQLLPQHAVRNTYSMHHILRNFSFFQSCLPPPYCTLDDVDLILFQEFNIVCGI